MSLSSTTYNVTAKVHNINRASHISGAAWNVLDVSKAFDKVFHVSLFPQLKE